MTANVPTVEAPPAVEHEWTGRRHVTLQRVRFEPRCSCRWRGPWRSTELAARDEWRLHVLLREQRTADA